MLCDSRITTWMCRITLWMLSAVAIVGTPAATGAWGRSVQRAPAATIVFTGGGSGRADLYVMQSDGLQVRLLARNAANAAVSPDRRRIAFVRGRAIWVMQRDGSHSVRLTSPGGPSKGGDYPGGKAIEDNGPAWSPDGRTIYFSRFVWKIETNSLFSIHEDGTRLRRITRAAPTDHGHCQDNPAPSPDGRVIAFAESSDCEHSSDIRVTAVTTSGRFATLAFDLREELTFDPAWSPDGRFLAYGCLDAEAAMAGRTGASGLYLSAADGSRTRRLVPDSDLRAPAWSADGKWIVFAGAHGISLVRADGTGRRALVKTGADPTWLPHV